MVSPSARRTVAKYLKVEKAFTERRACSLVQLSLYRYILEKYYGLKVEKLLMIHLLEYDYAEYQCDYLQSDIIQMLSYM